MFKIQVMENYLSIQGEEMQEIIYLKFLSPSFKNIIGFAWT